MKITKTETVEVFVEITLAEIEAALCEWVKDGVDRGVDYEDLDFAIEDGLVTGAKIIFRRRTES